MKAWGPVHEAAVLRSFSLLMIVIRWTIFVSSLRERVTGPVAVLRKLSITEVFSRTSLVKGYFFH
jgi:hypothetical protein